ncbi:F0F1 ATP synthase subunit B, partial [Okeania sp. SIO2G5]|uniref:F0F1 ATP synthase subunit B n=1 Tax=Okeania sp. SIO2G5 TaxID=2607796 RepID=UPI0013BECAB6
MENLLLLATEAAEHGGHGFGLNLDLFETNLINLSIIITLLVVVGRKVVGGILSERQAKIEAAIKDAEQRKQSAVSALAEQQQKLAQAKADAKTILANAEERAEKAKQAILAKADADVAQLQAAADADMGAQQEKAIAELRQRVTELALADVNRQLSQGVDDATQQRL